MTTNPPDKILDRVRKLLALSQRAGSEAEAANAAAKAADLMREYEITEAMAALDGAAVAPDPIQERAHLNPEDARRSVKRVAWKSAIAFAVARSLGVRGYYSYGAIVGLGRERQVQTWRYTTSYLQAEVDRLCEEAWEEEIRDKVYRPRVKAWKNAFRVGCAQRVATRLDQLTRERFAARRAEVAAAREALTEREQLSSPGPSAPSNAHAIVRVERDEEEVRAAYAKISKGFGRATAIGTTSSSGGYARGHAAGDRVSLGGSARGGLPAGRHGLGGGK